MPVQGRPHLHPLGSLPSASQGQQHASQKSGMQPNANPSVQQMQQQQHQVHTSSEYTASWLVLFPVWHLSSGDRPATSITPMSGKLSCVYQNMQSHSWLLCNRCSVKCTYLWQSAVRKPLALVYVAQLSAAEQRMQARGEGGGEQVAGPQVQLQGLREGMPLTLGGLPQPSAPLTALPGAAAQLEPDTQPASGTPAAGIEAYLA